LFGSKPLAHVIEQNNLAHAELRIRKLAGLGGLADMVRGAIAKLRGPLKRGCNHGELPFTSGGFSCDVNSRSGIFEQPGLADKKESRPKGTRDQQIVESVQPTSQIPTEKTNQKTEPKATIASGQRKRARGGAVRP